MNKLNNKMVRAEKYRGTVAAAAAVVYFITISTTWPVQKREEKLQPCPQAMMSSSSGSGTFQKFHELKSSFSLMCSVFLSVFSSISFELTGGNMSWTRAAMEL
eukprot:TRINITY_DN11734_c0_g1_i1.p1 TRINITY_DN11734_c0_g1~~TRINITY_DN11734_c0_g1_i1.p1  ORF type:complete len:103 (-),score=24.85 TRINITY_DN11734_c0_g1_i1:129-437(-)